MTELDDATARDATLFNHFMAQIVASVVHGEPLADTYARAEQLGPGCLLAADEPVIGDPAQHAVLFRIMARAIMDQTPRPELRFATRKQPRPGRNERCDCDSGRKFKHCCQPLEQRAPMDRMNVLPYVLEALPRKRWGELAGSAIDPEMVAMSAHELLEEGNANVAVALLEPWFKGDAPIPAAWELLLDFLLEAFTQLDQPRKQQKLLQAALDRGDRIIRSTALQRLATICSDDGEHTEAWKYFHMAQREHADSASLSNLEVLLLMAQGDVEQAQQRARFWVGQLSRIDAEEHRESIELLREIAEHGEQPLFEMQEHDWPELETLRSLLAQAPAPATMEQLRGGDGTSAGTIVPIPALRKALDPWRQKFPQIGPALTAMGVEEQPAWDDPEPWLEYLSTQPLLWQSLDVLDDLVLALSSVPVFGIEQTLIEPLLTRAESLLDQLLVTEGAEGKLLEWGIQENRPALRLLAQWIVPDLDAPSDATMARMHKFLALNPNDNHGFRGDLMAAFIRRGRFEDADQLGMRFEADPELAFDHVLALWAMRRNDDAMQRLQQAHARLPRLLPMMLAKNPPKPPIQEGFIRYGGPDQAWLCRERQRPLWESMPGALDWLRKAKRELE